MASVVATLPDRSLSVRQQLPDEWYRLHNPDQPNGPLRVKFRTARADFPPNLEDLKVKQVVVYFARARNEMLELDGVSLTFMPFGSGEAKGWDAGASIDGVISTRRGNAGQLRDIRELAPFGEWELTLPGEGEHNTREHFKQKKIEDILFVISYASHTPDWPE